KNTKTNKNNNYNNNNNNNNSNHILKQQEKDELNEGKNGNVNENSPNKNSILFNKSLTSTEKICLNKIYQLIFQIYNKNELNKYNFKLLLTSHSNALYNKFNKILYY